MRQSKTIRNKFLSFTRIFYYSKNNQSHLDDKQILLGSTNRFFPILRWLRKAYGYQIVNEWSFEFLYSLLNFTEPIPRPYYRSLSKSINKTYAAICLRLEKEFTYMRSTIKLMSEIIMVTSKTGAKLVTDLIN